jgi:hypothetical protein
MGSYEIDDVDRLGRLEGIQRHLQKLEGKDYTYLHLPNLFEADPVSEPPFQVASSFIPEAIGGNIRILNRIKDDTNPLGTENLEQMLGSFLPGGYKQRWGKFYRWQGDWEVNVDEVGYADIEPMFEFDGEYPLADVLDTEYEGYTGMELPTEEVAVYTPRIMYVRRIPQDSEYYWHEDTENIFANQDPLGSTLPLGQSDPTANYLWFRHYQNEPSGDRTDLSDSRIFHGYRFEPETEFLRCYYASLLTLYEKRDNNTLSRIIQYEHGKEDTQAFVGAREESQLLLFDVDRATIRSRIAHVFSREPSIERDVRFSLLYREVWDRLFFEKGILEHVFAVNPFVKHLVGADFWCRDINMIDAESVFDLTVEKLETILASLLDPEEGDGRLTLMGYDSKQSSDVLEVMQKNRNAVKSIFETCADRDKLLSFAEDVVIHSIEHALATWATEETPAGGSFELWYDVNFQQRDESIAYAGIYDSIQGGAGIATEVYDYLQSISQAHLDTGVGRQGACHTAAADQTVITLLANTDTDTLYELFQERGGEESNENPRQHQHTDADEQRDWETGFRGQLIDARNEVLSDQPGNFNTSDVSSRAEKRIQSLFETRETARFYGYVASQYEEVAERLERTPRSVDLLLHLDRDIIRDPRVRETYQQFTMGSRQSDLSELGERLEELTVQCITACPDCLETDGTDCVHGMKYQSEMLNRRLLSEVCSY